VVSSLAAVVMSATIARCASSSLDVCGHGSSLCERGANERLKSDPDELTRPDTA
jgi:hypothetical protein